jgi:hypothetical protein
MSRATRMDTQSPALQVADSHEVVLVQRSRGTRVACLVRVATGEPTDEWTTRSPERRTSARRSWRRSRV